MTFDISALSGATPAEFAAAVKGASKSDLEAALSGDHRATLLGTIFARFPDQFRADRAGATSAVVHWTITGGPADPETFELVIADGTCVLSPAPQADPKLAVTVGGLDFLKLVAGAANPMTMFMTGKLKAKGDLGLAANLANLFDLPRS